MKTSGSPGRWLIILPPLLFLLLFFLIPFAFAFKISFAESAARVPPFTDVVTWTPDHHLRLAATLANYRYLLTDEVYGVAYLFSLRTAFFSTLICLVLGYPMAYAIARAPRATQNVLLLVIMLPFWTSFLLRVYALEGIIRDNGLLNTVLLHLGLIEQPLRIMRTNLAVYLGIIYSYLPFMVLPLSVPGMIAGSMLVFIPAVGEFVIPSLLGGPNNLMIGRVLWDEFFGNHDWPVAAAVAIAFLLLLVGPIAVYQYYNVRQLEA